MRTRLKKSEYAVAVDRDGRVGAEGGAAAHFGHEWTAEHLLLAALARCSLAALAYHARRDGLWVQASATRHGVVERRGGRRLGLHGDRLRDRRPLRIRRRQCPATCWSAPSAAASLGASLDPRPRYEWTVNGKPTLATAPAEPTVEPAVIELLLVELRPLLKARPHDPCPVLWIRCASCIPRSLVPG